jgi:ABC-2 type transport system ATP-binding protein
MTEFAIDVRGLVKKFGDKVAVNGVDIQLPKGEVWGFLGPNGSGKTTTIRMICGLLKVTEGQGECLGYDIVKDAEMIRRLTGYMTQKFSFWNDLSIRENLEFVARLYQMPNMKQQVDRTLEVLGLTARQKQLAGALSGG